MERAVHLSGRQAQVLHECHAVGGRGWWEGKEVKGGGVEFIVGRVRLRGVALNSVRLLAGSAMSAGRKQALGIAQTRGSSVAMWRAGSSRLLL